MDNPALSVGPGANPSTRSCPTDTGNGRASFLSPDCALRGFGQSGDPKPSPLNSGGTLPAIPDPQFCGTAARGADLSDMDILLPAFLTQLPGVHGQQQHGIPDHRPGPSLSAATTGQLLACHRLDRNSIGSVANTKTPQTRNLLAEKSAGMRPRCNLKISSTMDDRGGTHASPVPIASFGFEVRLRRHLYSMNHN